MHVPLTATCDVPAPEAGEPAWDRLPASRGVVLFEDPDAATSLIATCANIRALARRRLEPPPDAPGAPARGPVNLRSITGVVRAAPTGSSFESDLAYLELARERLPHVYRSVTDRWQGWFIEVEPETTFPRFVKTPTSALAGAPGKRFFGPTDKHGAARFIELLEDLFDLCRYHHVLVQAPHGTACVYKEMGKCPAPCDGSESMDRYRARLGEAVRFADDPRGAIDTADAAMREASGQLDFERAGELRSWIERASEATKKKFKEVGDLVSMRMIAVAPSEHGAWARLIAIAPGHWSIPMDVRRDAPPDELAALARAALDRLPACAFTRPEMDRLGLLCTWLARSEKMKRGVRFVRLGDDFDDALRKALRSSQPANADDDEPTQEIGAGDTPPTHAQTQPTPSEESTP